MPQPVAAGLLKQYLEQRQVAGQTHVGLRPGVLDKMTGRSARPAVAPQRAPEPRRVAESFSEERAAPASLLREAFVAPVVVTPAPAPARVAAAKAPTAVPTLIEVPGMTKAEKLTALAQIAEQSPEARALGTLRETMVFAVGSPDAEIMFIGEAPGSEEERQQEPFVGPAGQKLTGIIKAMGLDRSEVYISNICKFRPAMENQGWSNRPPTTVEMKTCLPYIFTEISIVQPKVLVALGKTAAEGLGLSGPVSKLRGQFYEVQGLPTMVTFHPSYILREEKLADGGRVAKRQVWEDMLQVMEKTGLPISDKQRGYFKK
ncbi:uracil-DNA glycosylase [Prosthecobacter dejongeii]|uniref:Type-4 uracil-DNA glycosylase n=1 Tax=Prosthecobacter dejongeii TaxID=48465 RepID=A0A7W7YNF0_9BACT|nr:uracil-DNA glycosylase [Prosthecobacter dejongeii]MBB5039431.1 DNA polymerase [Prosthecobacter dejongeii]